MVFGPLDGYHSQRPSPVLGTDCRSTQTNATQRRPVSPMWELEREPALPALARLRCAVVGDGRLGRAMVSGLREAGLTADGPLGRGARCSDADVVLLCVPDAEIANA